MRSYRVSKDDLINAGADSAEASAGVDRNLVTAAGDRDNPVWMKETLDRYED